MQPPYEITSTILQLVTSISEKVGEVKAYHISIPSPKLRKKNQIKSVRASLAIEGNTLDESQITALLEGKRVLGTQKEIQEVKNAIQVYEALTNFNAESEVDFLSAHALLMSGLVDKAGEYRIREVGIVQSGTKLSHLAPPAWNVPNLMQSLFTYLTDSQEIPLIKSCVFHYELEFIHPFEDGNGRMGRLWQTLLLAQEYPIFLYLPVETLVHEQQQAYYEALAQSDKSGQSTIFIEYMLSRIDAALEDYLAQVRQPQSAEERLRYFFTLSSETNTFKRKDYLQVFRDLSSATASRDLQKGVSLGWLKKTGDKRTTNYTIQQVEL
ncbi:MAG: Fic family protein [Bacteroidota bacterium]